MLSADKHLINSAAYWIDLRDEGGCGLLVDLQESTSIKQANRRRSAITLKKHCTTGTVRLTSTRPSTRASRKQF
jgi:hypothetical protein